jgi:hypothetical protein
MHEDIERASFMSDLWDRADEADDHESLHAMKSLQTNVIVLGEIQTQLTEMDSEDREKAKLQEFWTRAKSARQAVEAATTVLRSIYSYGHPETLAKLTWVDNRSKEVYVVYTMTRCILPC